MDNKFETAFQTFAIDAANAHEAIDVINLFERAREVESTCKSLVENARMKMLLLIQRDGHPIPDGKGMQLIVNGRKVEARKSRDGLDVKKIQAWLQVRGHAPQRALAEKLTFALAPDTANFLRELGADDATLAGLNTDEATWSVYKPVDVKTEG